MHFNTSIIFTVALMAGQIMGAPVDAPAKEPRGSLIASDPYYACNCPNNCDHQTGDSCKYYSGISDTSRVLKGTCSGRHSQSLTCYMATPIGD